MQIATLKLLQLADSALPIGATAHSFGLETLVCEGSLVSANLPIFLHDHLIEVGQQEAVACRLAYQLGQHEAIAPLTGLWESLNETLSALKPARESREASATLGRRFLQMAAKLEGDARLAFVGECGRAARVEIHYCAAFGLVGGVLQLGEDETIGAYLQQGVTNLLSTCQRLLPLGQSQALQINWRLKSALAEIADRSKILTSSCATHSSFGYISQFQSLLFALPAACTPMLDIASMRHRTLPTRLFIS